jgi:hypothetical protein
MGDGTTPDDSATPDASATPATPKTDCLTCRATVITYQSSSLGILTETNYSSSDGGGYQSLGLTTPSFGVSGGECVVLPAPGNTEADVVTGFSAGGSATFGGEVAGSANLSGGMICGGAALAPPGVSGNVTYGWSVPAQVTPEPLPPEVEQQMYTPVGDGLEVENWDAFR